MVSADCSSSRVRPCRSRYEIIDAYRQYKETYLPLRLENYPREMWENFKKFFKIRETDEIDDDP